MPSISGVCRSFGWERLVCWSLRRGERATPVRLPRRCACCVLCCVVFCSASQRRLNVGSVCSPVGFDLLLCLVAALEAHARFRPRCRGREQWGQVGVRQGGVCGVGEMRGRLTNAPSAQWIRALRPCRFLRGAHFFALTAWTHSRQHTYDENNSGTTTHVLYTAYPYDPTRAPSNHSRPRSFRSVPFSAPC